MASAAAGQAPILVGLNHVSAPLAVREALAVSPAEVGPFLEVIRARPEVSECVLLSTCNRVELICAATGRPSEPLVRALAAFKGLDADALRPLVYCHERAEAVRHVFRVVSSLDSMVVGEPHILGQVREAWERARVAGTVGPLLDRLFRRALTVGKNVRAKTEIATRPVSVSSVAVDLAAGIYGDLAQCRVLVLGAGEMSRLTTQLLASRGVESIVVVNRSVDRGRALAQRFGGTFRPWGELEEALIEPHIVLSSLRVEAPLLTADMLDRIMARRHDAPLFLIDLSVPRSIDPDVRRLYNVYCYDLDDFHAIAEENLRQRQRYVPEAQALVDAAVAQYEAWRAGLRAVPTIRQLRSRAETIRDRELESHLRRLDGLTDRQRRIVESLAHAITNKFLHAPTVRLRSAADEGVLQAARVLFELDEEQPGEDDS